MRVHKVTAFRGEDQIAVRYLATAALAKETRRDWVGIFDVPLKKIDIEQTEIPTAKPELLEFINGLCREQDVEREEEEAEEE